METEGRGWERGRQGEGRKEWGGEKKTNRERERQMEEKPAL